jgi:hypothetical protein
MIQPDPFRHAAQSGDRLSLSDLLDLHGEASPAVLLLVLSVPELRRARAAAEAAAGAGSGTRR